jgi:hypothetical protein
MKARETARIIKALGAKTSARQVRKNVTHKTKLARARRDATVTADRYSRENATAIELIREIYSDKIQHVLSLHFDLERQVFMTRHDVDPYTLTAIWYDVMENHSNCGWILCDLEFERDRREGRLHHWKRYSWNGEAINAPQGPQLAFDGFGEVAQ